MPMPLNLTGVEEWKRRLEGILGNLNGKIDSKDIRRFIGDVPDQMYRRRVGPIMLDLGWSLTVRRLGDDCKPRIAYIRGKRKLRSLNEIRFIQETDGRWKLLIIKPKKRGPTPKNCL